MSEQINVVDSTLESCSAISTEWFQVYAEMSRFNCRKAIKILEEVPSKHRRSSWVLGHLGKAYFELNEYKEAKRYHLHIFLRLPRLGSEPGIF
jgi:anaphase-promoting complex subunit 3